MGYTTEFYGRIELTPPLNQQEIEYLRKFSGTRRMKRTKGPYYVDGTGDFGQDHEDDVLHYNAPDPSQPSLWCQWVPTDDGAAIEWDGGEKFYSAAEWMKYIIDHFIGSSPKAKTQLPFLQGHLCEGSIRAQGEDPNDQWGLIVRGDTVLVASVEVVYNNERTL